MIRIAIVEGGGEVRSHLLEQASIHVGRDAGNDVVLRDGYISGRHGRIRVNEGRVVYEDLSTTNGSVLRRGGRMISIVARPRLGPSHCSDFQMKPLSSSTQ